MRKKYLFCFFLLSSFCLQSCYDDTNPQAVKVSSPDGRIQLNFHLKEGIPYYNVSFNKKEIISDSRLGFEFDSLASLKDNFTIASVDSAKKDETWTQPWGEVKEVRDNHHSVSITLEEEVENPRKLEITFKLFNDGLGFRYKIPGNTDAEEFKIMDELTEFNFTQNYDTWWIPAYGDGTDYEYLFSENSLYDLDENVHTPLTMAGGDSLFVSIHEAALIDYAAMTLKPSGDGKLKCDLVPWSTGEKVRGKSGLVTPWRSIQIAETPGDLITSYLILNLNEPNKLKDVSWIKPGKYAGIWWGMHIKTQTWIAGPNHGASTENVMELIDFAAENGLSAVLVEGWNQGWEGDWSQGNFKFSEPYPDYDIEKLSAYAREKGVGIIAHHETGGNIDNYEPQMKEAYEFCQKHNIHALKTGYVTGKPNGKEWHQSQFMVNHYNKSMQMTADHQIMLDIHEPVKATGLRRTYPNMMTREGVRGTEYEAWSSGNPPSHTAILPFTRGLAGPIDYTPGIFDITIENQPGFRIHTTLAKQLALYVVIYSPLHMVPDLPEHYEGNPAFKFIQDVPTDWEETKVLNAAIGDYITTVRKDRNSDDWYLGSITNEEGREFNITLDFLDPEKEYTAEIYADGDDASMEENPLSVSIYEQTVNSSMQLPLNLAPGGGQAIRFRPL